MPNDRTGNTSVGLVLFLARSGSSFRLTSNRRRVTLFLCVLNRPALFDIRRIVFRGRTGNAEFTTLSKSLCATRSSRLSPDARR